MKFVFTGKAQQHPEVAGLLTEDVLVNKESANRILKAKNLEVERIEQIGNEKIVYIRESSTNLLLG